MHKFATNVPVEFSLFIPVLHTTGQMAQVVRRMLLGSNLEPIKSLTRCQLLATIATLMYRPWRKATELGTAHS